MRARSFPDVVLHDLPTGWPVPRVGEAVQFTGREGEPTWLVVDVLYTFVPNVGTPAIVIKLHPEG